MLLLSGLPATTLAVQPTLASLLHTGDQLCGSENVNSIKVDDS